MVFNKTCVWVQVHMTFYAKEFVTFSACRSLSLSFCAVCVHKMGFSMNSYNVKKLFIGWGRTPFLAPRLGPASKQIIACLVNSRSEILWPTNLYNKHRFAMLPLMQNFNSVYCIDSVSKSVNQVFFTCCFSVSILSLLHVQTIALNHRSVDDLTPHAISVHFPDTSPCSVDGGTI